MRSAATDSLPSLPASRYLAYKTEIDDAIARVFASGQFILGAQTAAFEAEFARFLGASHCVGVASGTDALELALRACGVGAGDAVMTVSWTATATVAAIERAGATPVFVDVDADTFTMDPEDLAKIIAEHLRSASGPKLKAVIPVHLYGHPADMPSIVRIARTHGLKIVEDCAQSHGATLDGRTTGTWGDAAAFSFYPTKNLGAFGDAGAVVTNDDALAERVRLLREYGWQPRHISSIPGVNSRLDELQAAMLRVLLKHLPAENRKRQELAHRYADTLSRTGVTVPLTRSSTVHAFHQYVIRSSRRDPLKSFLQDQGIATQIHYPAPVHLQPAYAGRVLHRSLPRTEAAAREVLSLPMSPYFEHAQIAKALAALTHWQKGKPSSA